MCCCWERIRNRTRRRPGLEECFSIACVLNAGFNSAVLQVVEKLARGKKHALGRKRFSRTRTTTRTITSKRASFLLGGGICRGRDPAQVTHQSIMINLSIDCAAVRQVLEVFPGYAGQSSPF